MKTPFGSIPLAVPLTVLLAGAGFTSTAMEALSPEYSASGQAEADRALLPQQVPALPAGGAQEEADLTITQRIRRAILSDQALSAAGWSVQIMTVDGRVTLYGPVGSREEKDRIGALCREIAAGAEIENQIEVVQH